jgi:hypothetical protein
MLNDRSRRRCAQIMFMTPPGMIAVTMCYERSFYRFPWIKIDVGFPTINPSVVKF